MVLRDSQGIVRGTILTNNDGNARFVNLPPAAYQLSAVMPAGFIASTTHPLVVDLKPNDDLQVELGLASVWHRQFHPQLIHEDLT